jgi:hypothetical protein
MTKIAYRRTFAQFADTYLTTYYAAGFRIIVRSAGGPFLMFLGAVFYIFSRNPNLPWLARIPLFIIGVGMFAYGLYFALRPFIDLALVYLRRDEFLGAEGQTIEIEIRAEALYASLPEGDFEIPFSNILTVQHRSDSAWIITRTDQILQVPREDLLEGDHDAFVERLYQIVNPPKEA